MVYGTRTRYRTRKVVITDHKGKHVVYRGNLGGWTGGLSAERRRQLALASRPKSWGLARRYLSAGRALTGVSVVNENPRTRRSATVDARYFYNVYHKAKPRLVAKRVRRKR